MVSSVVATSRAVEFVLMKGVRFYADAHKTHVRGPAVKKI